MAVTPGSASKLNAIKGITRIMSVSAAEVEALGVKVLAAGILLKFADGKLYLTDGVTAVNALTPIVDTAVQPISGAAKTALDTTFAGGSYAAAAGGMVVLETGAKINDAQLNVVADGKIVASYLADFYDGASNKIKLESIPDSVRLGFEFVENITARDALDAEQKKKLVLVVDASDDATVNAGSAVYAWTGTEWTKVSEFESLDLDIDALTPSYKNVQAAGAVMYDHAVVLEAPTLTELNALLAAE